ncbi:MAG: AMP-binding protein, partial [Bilophila sp.]
EEFLLQMEDIADVQVVAVPSRRYGEEVGAFIIAREGSDVAPEDVRDFCRGQIAWYKIPRYVAVVTEYPLTASGKIQKYKLRQMAAEFFPEAMRERGK